MSFYSQILLNVQILEDKATKKKQRKQCKEKSTVEKNANWHSHNYL